MPPLSRNRRASRRRANRTLSNYKIATRTSARAQARQIYALARRISSIQRRTRPETVTITRTSAPIAPISSTSSIGLVSWYTTSSTTSPAPVINFVFPPLGTPSNPSYGDANTNPPNLFARLSSFTLYGDMRFDTLVDTISPITLRIVVCQTKATRSDALSSADIFSPSNTGNSAFAQVFGPLQTGLARTVKVLSDKRYTLSYQRPSVTIKTRLRYLLNFYRDFASSSGTAGESIPKGAIYVFYATYTAASDQAAPTLRLMYKLAYFDN